MAISAPAVAALGAGVGAVGGHVFGKFLKRIKIREII